MKVPLQLNGLVSMNKWKLLNIIIICWALFAVGLSLSIMAPFYPRETLDRGVSVTVSGKNLRRFSNKGRIDPIHHIVKPND